MQRWIPDQFCTGCGACENACPVDALRIAEDEKGFLYPNIDEAVCVSCGKCSDICPMSKLLAQEPIHIPSRSPEPNVYACRCLDKETRLASSSGGAFSGLARAVLADGGCVIGAAFSEDFSHAVHITVENEDGLARLRDSKYVQSETGTVYREVKERLKAGRQVLFSGLSCQIAGLYAYLEEDADHPLLTTIDFICRGVNSSKAYRSWLNELTESFGGKVISLRFRDKTTGGWRDPRTTVAFDNGAVYSKSLHEDEYMRAYLEYRAAVRPSCTNCRFKEPMRVADIRLADYWGLDASQDDGLGMSLVFVCSEKGERLFSQLKDGYDTLKTELATAGKGNRCLYAPVEPGPYSDWFFDRLTEGIPFRQIINEIDAKKREDEPSLSVVIPHSDAKRSVAPLLKRLSMQDCEKMQIVLIDGTKDGTLSEQTTGLAKQVVYLKKPGEDLLSLIASGLEQCTGDIIHIADDETGFVWKGAYRSALAKMKEANAEVGCFGWLDASGKNVVRNGFSGTGSGRMTAEYAFDTDRTADAASYGGQVFNKLFSRKWLNRFFPQKIRMDPDLFEMAYPAFLTQIGDACITALFSADPVFRRSNDAAAAVGKPFQADTFFASAKAFLADTEQFRPYVFAYAARAFYQYELRMYSNAVNNGWEKLQNALETHLLTYYPGILGEKALAEELLRMKPKADASEKQVKSLEWRIERQKAQSEQKIASLNDKNRQTQQMLNDERRKNRELNSELQKQRSVNRSVQGQLSDCRKTLNGRIVRKAVSVQNCAYRLKNRLSGKQKQGE